jgi:hypothetical protein
VRFDHVANRLDDRHFEVVVEMFTTRLGFVLLRQTERSVWLRQPGRGVDLQFSRSETTKRDADKRRSQVAFLSETPREALEALAAWCRDRGVAAEVGAYSDREFFLDLPDAFVDFVLEAMRPELADYGTDAPPR